MRHVDVIADSLSYLSAARGQPDIVSKHVRSGTHPRSIYPASIHMLMSTRGTWVADKDWRAKRQASDEQCDRRQGLLIS